MRGSKHNILFKDFFYISDTINNLVTNEEAIWCIAVLTHDLGYPIKKISKINKSIQKILPYFHVKNYDEFNFNYTNVQQSFIDDFIELMCCGFELSFEIDTEEDSEIGKIIEKAIIKEDGKILVDDNELDKLSETEYKKLQQYMGERSNIKMIMDITKRLSFSNDFEHYEHGIMSAFLLMKTIYSFNTFKFSYSDYNNILQDEVDVAKFISFHEILNAVTNHTCSFQMKA